MDAAFSERKEMMTWVLSCRLPAALAAGSLLLLLAGGARADLSDTIARVKPAVVIVGTFKATNSPRFTMRGTGFVVGNGNLAITNAHVLPEGAEFDADTRPPPLRHFECGS